MLQKIYLGLSLLILSSAVCAQNVQLHYVPRHAMSSEDFNSNLMVTTVEMFKPDKWGSTFAFIDMSYDGAKGGISSAYWEIARDLRFWKCPIAAHIEYNGGVVGGAPDAIPNAYLVGASYPFTLGKAFMSTYVAYKYNAFQKHSDDIQWTVTWNLNLLNDKLSIGGFMDLWTENKNRLNAPGEDGKKVILLAQPQFWFNATPNLAVGTEVEISNNFQTTSSFEANKFFVIPTLSAKWTF